MIVPNNFVMQKILKRNTLNEAIFYLLGFSSTSIALALVFAGHVVSIYSLSLIACFVVLLRGGHKKFSRFNFIEKTFFYWMMIGFLSSLFGLLFFFKLPAYQEAIISFIPKLIIYFALFILLKNSEKRHAYCEKIIHGILLGVIVNLIWGVLDATIYYSTGESITNNLFRGFIDAMQFPAGELSQIEAGGAIIRSGGLNADPSNIGLFATILTFYSLAKKNYWYIMLGVLGVFASLSFIALVGMFIEFLIFVVLFKDRFALKIGLLFLLIFIIAFYFLYNSTNDVVQSFNAAFENKLEVKQDETNTTDMTNIRMVLFTQFFTALSQMPSAFFIGTGFMTSSYAYRGLLPRSAPHDPENHYVSTFFDLGLIGFVFYFLFFLLALKKFGKKRLLMSSDYNLIVFSCISATLITYWAYHFTMYSVNLLVSLCAMFYLYSPQRIKEEIEKNE